MDKIRESRLSDFDDPPAVLTLAECKLLLKTCGERDSGLIRYVAVCLLAGLRPEREAANLNPDDIGKTILIRGVTAKSRQARFVEIVPALKAWLKLGGNYPIQNLRKRFASVRQQAGLLEGWKQDCMRHTFASAFYAVYGAERTIAALGHGDYDMLFRHYRTLMSREEAEKILNISPRSLGMGRDQ